MHGIEAGWPMTRVFFAVIAALLVSTGESEKKAPHPLPNAQLTPVQLASAPSHVVTLTQAQTVTASVVQPLRACGCSSAPAPLDVFVLLGLLVMRTFAQRITRYRD